MKTSFRPMHTKHPKSVSVTNPSTFQSVPSLCSQISTYRSFKLELQIYSPSVKVQQGNLVGESLVPVFSETDRIEGKLTLDPSCHHSGVLFVTIEGSLHYRLGKDGVGNVATRHDGKHVILSSTVTIAVSPCQVSARSGLALYESFMKRRPSFSSKSRAIIPAERTYPFSIPVTSSTGSGEGLPPSSIIVSCDSEDFEISYVVIASWQPSDGTVDKLSRLEIPIHYHPEIEFQSCALTTIANDSWLELPLRADHPASLWCAVALPTSVTFTRGSSIPYFVVFTTKPRSTALAREIATDATISVSLVRKITLTEQVHLPPSPPETPASSNDEPDMSRRKLLKLVRNGSKAPRYQSSAEGEELLSRLPTQVVFSDTKNLLNNVSIGFPKRPRYPPNFRKHPTVEEIAALPDGLYRSRIPLGSSMLPSINIEGLIVKYYFDVSVLFGQDDLRARIPIRVV
ncbi:hypothetical protein APHAL10511_006812 [Amanita phalloides]|nr:hypothetical protein APHAL10511_006812 [Amanita phalloides]